MAEEQLARLEVIDLPAASCIHAALDLLAADPGAVRNRRRRYQTIGLWGISVACHDEVWLILWEPGEDDDVVVVAHIVPAP